MNFMIDLSLSLFSRFNDIYDSILIVVDRFIKMTHYILVLKRLTAQQFATIFIHEIVRLHEMSSIIIFDRDHLFTSHF